MKKVECHLFIMALAIFSLASCDAPSEVRKADRLSSSRGGIVVYGREDCVKAVSDYMLSCDDFDNVSGRAVSDSLPDFAGEIILKINLDPSVQTDSLDHLIPASLDTVTFRDGGKYYIEARDTSFDSVRAQAVQCYRVLRFRNAFTHRIAYPQSESFLLFLNPEGDVVIKKTDGDGNI